MALSADQQAMLQLLLERGQSYTDLGSLLGAEEAEVRSRARAALTELAGADPDRNVGLTDYLLGQADPIGRADAVRHLKDDPADLELASGDRPEAPPDRARRGAAEASGRGAPPASPARTGRRHFTPPDSRSPAARTGRRDGRARPAHHAVQAPDPDRGRGGQRGRAGGGDRAWNRWGVQRWR